MLTHLYRVLVADDNLNDLALLSEAIQEAGVPIHLTACNSAQQALDQVGERPAYDLILSDINMPGMNGIELADKLATLPLASTVPTLLMSSYEHNGTRESLHPELDRLPYFTKPNDWPGFMNLAHHLYAALQRFGTSKEIGDELGAHVGTRAAG